MKTKQQIFRVRRNYNQWVNNQTLEDYALRFTAKAARRWSLARVANTALGAISFLVLEAIGAAITINYGFENAMAAVLVVGALIFFAGLPICYYAAKYGVDIDLLTRGAGFGYIGATATSLIYASFTFIFFALEAAIMAKALELMLGLPLAIGYVFSSIIVIPLVFYGITFISRFQLWSQPVWIVLQLAPFVFILMNDANLLSEWTHYQNSKYQDDGFNVLLFGAAASVMFALVAQIGEQVDFLRFLPQKTQSNKFRWWGALLIAGPGWILVGCIKILIGSFLAVTAIRYGVPETDAMDPTTMYAIAFGFIVKNQHLALILSGVFVVLSQVKINVTNAYAGSIAWSNFFSRLTHNHPGRVVWLVFNVSIALLLMELGIYHTFETTLSIYAVVAVSWVGALVADLVINKPLGLSPSHIEFKRAYLYDINPVGVGAMLAASIIGIASYLEYFGPYFHALAHFIALGTAFVVSPLIAHLTKGRYYIARAPYIFTDRQTIVECAICQNHFENEDMAHCPAYDGYICSLCCSLDARCLDTCKTQSKVSYQILDLSHRWLPEFASKYVNIRILHFSFLLILVASVTGVLLTLIYSNIKTESFPTNLLLEETLWKVFFILLIVAGVICWLFVLARHSQIVAQEESQTQTQRLIEEIAAHEKTDKKLKLAKEHAEAANNAKSRYITGISHELRSPLNTVMGYAQLMEMDEGISISVREKVAVIKRSSEHLADLIEGLLDISKIESGRLDIERNRIRFQNLIDHIVEMFRVEAEDKDLSFICKQLSPIPDAVMGDEKRLRQILINLLSNAIKYTEHGGVKFMVSYRNQVAKFIIEDSGVGIDPDDYELIFRPFERVRRPGSPAVSGTGLGLTITRLLIDIMGGDLTVEPNPTGGTVFTVWLMLSSATIPVNENIKTKKILGYQGRRRTIMIVDDDATHRGIISSLLSPLGFEVIEAHEAETCLNMLSMSSPDIFLIDRLMPGMDGPDLAKKLRQVGVTVPILLVTANANEDIEVDKQVDISGRKPDGEAYDDYLIKPIRLEYILQRLAKYLSIEWIFKEQKFHFESPLFVKNVESRTPSIYAPISKYLRDTIVNYCEIGNLTGLKNICQNLSENAELDPAFVNKLRDYINSLKFNKIIKLVDELANE